MNILNTLTLRHLKLNKKRTIVTIIGVILSVSMLTAVPTFMASFLEMMRQNEIVNKGNWHVIYKGVSSQDIGTVTEDRNTLTASLAQDIGYAILQGSKNEHKPYLFIRAFDEQSFDSFRIRLKEGRFPSNADEVVLSSHIAENGGVVYQVGDKLKLDIGKRYKEENGNKRLLSQEDNFVSAASGESEQDKSEQLLIDTTREYTVTGIIERSEIEPYWAPGYTAVAYLDRDKITAADSLDIAVTWKNVTKAVNVQANELAAGLGITGNNVSYHSDLLRLYGIMGDNMLETLYSLAAIVIGLILFGSVALIYNSFAISISERGRHLGMLASVGATKKQKRNSVFFEGFVIGVIGVPLGIVFGTIGIGITFLLVQPLMEFLSFAGVKLTLVTSPEIILLTCALSIITIFISAYIPAMRAAKISPIDAIRQSQDVKLTNRKVKTSKLTRRLFGFEAELGLKNLKRNSRRYKATIFSLVISIVLFLSVSSLSLLTQRSSDIVSGKIPYDVQVWVTSSAGAQEKRDFYDAVAKMNDIEESVIEQTMYASVNADAGQLADEIKPFIEPAESGQYDIFIQIKAVDEAALLRYGKELNLDAAVLKDTQNPQGILINSITTEGNGKYARIKQFTIDVGEKLKLVHQLNDGLGEYSTELEIAATADSTPIGETTFINASQGMLYVSEDVYTSIQGKLPNGQYDSNMEMMIKSANPTGLVKAIKEYQTKTPIGNVNITDIAEINRNSRQFETFIFVFFYGFVALITAICIANIFNTISTSISLRKREFAMLKSIGMTPKGFSKMINYESLFYGIKALLYGLPLSFGMMYWIYTSLSNSFGFEFAIPWGSVMIAVVAVFAIVSSTMLYASAKIKKENIIDSLKNENI